MKKKLVLFLSVLLLVTTLSGCTKDNESDENDDIVLSTTSVKLNIGESVIITAVVKSNSILTFSSDDTSIAVVDANGKITGVSEGTTKVYAKAGNTRKAITITVNGNGGNNQNDPDPNQGNNGEKEDKKLSDIKLVSENLAVKEGESFTLTYTLEPEGITGVTVTFSSNDEKVATVDNTGKITGIKKGETDIIIKANDITKKAHIVVSAAVTKNDIVFTNDTIDTDSQYYPTLTLYNDNTFELFENIYSGFVTYYGTYESNNKKVVLTVDGCRYNNEEATPDVKSIKFYYSSSGHLFLQQDLYMSHKGDLFIKNYSKKIAVGTYYGYTVQATCPELVLYSDHSAVIIDADYEGFPLRYNGRWDLDGDVYLISNIVGDSDSPKVNDFKMEKNDDGSLTLRGKIITTSDGENWTTYEK